MARSPIPDMIERYHQMTPEEQKCFLDLVDPQPEPEAPAKQTRKKRTRSPRQQSLSNALTTSREAKAEGSANNGADEDAELKCGICGNTRGHADHDRTYLKSHDFEFPKSVAGATKKSSRKPGAAKGSGSSTPSSETLTDSVGSAHPESRTSASGSGD